MGKAKEQVHTRSTTQSTVPMGIIDYMFLGEKKEDREEEEGTMPVLVYKCKKSKNYFASVVPEKGVCEFSVRFIKEAIDFLGHRYSLMGLCMVDYLWTSYEAFKPYPLWRRLYARAHQ